MAIPLKQYLDRFAAIEKKANETLSATPDALVGVDSLPGSEHDAKVPEDAKKPDEEVAQGQPAGATSASGAVNGGDAKPLNEGKLEVNQPLLNPEQKPLVTDDALTAKTADAHLASLVSDLLADIQSGAQKQASCTCGEGATHAAAPKVEKKEEKKDGEEKKASKTAITLDDETISKIAAAQATFMLGREAAEKAIKQVSASKLTPENARNLIKAACVKAAQDQGLAPADAEAAAANAMATAGMAPAEAAAVDAGAAAADAGAAEAAATDAAAADTAGIPEDVTEEELATAIVDLVGSGELDPDTAKALVEEIAGDAGAAAPTEDQAAEIIAQGLESGEITPEQAEQIAAAVETGAAGEVAADAEAAAGADAEAQGAADAEAAIKDAQDEAQGAADAEAAIKAAAAHLRSKMLSKVASAINAKRTEKKAAEAKPVPGSKVLAKVASILEARKAEKQAAANQSGRPTDAELYLAGFKKKAEEMGVDPAKLADYIHSLQPAK